MLDSKKGVRAPKLRFLQKNIFYSKSVYGLLDRVHCFDRAYAIVFCRGNSD